MLSGQLSHDNIFELQLDPKLRLALQYAFVHFEEVLHSNVVEPHSSVFILQSSQFKILEAHIRLKLWSERSLKDKFVVRRHSGKAEVVTATFIHLKINLLWNACAFS